MELDVTMDVRKAQDMLFRIRDREILRGAAVALNRTITTVRNEAAKDLKQRVGAELGLGASGLKKALRITKAAARPGRLWAALTVSGRAMPLVNFGARQTAQGVTHKAWGRRQIAEGAFIARMPSGHRGVYRRLPQQYLARSTKGRSPSAPNLPIKEMWGPSLPKEFVQPHINNRMKELARREWKKNFQREINYRMSQISKK